MRRLRGWLVRWGGLFGKTRQDRELAEELESHLQMHIEENLARGMTPEEARRQALLKLGGLEQTKESYRDRRGLPWFESLLQDVRFGLRMLRKNPGFTATAVLTLALGIGATTAVFSVVNGVLLEPLPYPDPNRIVALSTAWKQKGHTIPRVTGGDFMDFESGNQAFEALGVYWGGRIGVQVGNHSEFEGVYFVNPDFARVFSVAPVYGRMLGQADEDRSALVSFPFAMHEFGGAAALGKSISVNNQIYQIAGVLPSGFGFPDKAEVWAAAPARLLNLNRNSYNYYAVAKLKAGVTMEHAQAQLDTLAARLSAIYPNDNTGKTFTITPLRERMVAPARTTVWLLMIAVSLVLLISCSNVANLLLARAAARSHEIALRAALGATPRRILRQLLMESLVLALLAGFLGVLLATAGTAALVRLAPENLPRLNDVHMNWFVLGFAGGISILATILSGLLPAARASRVDLRESLEARGSRGILGGHSARLRGALVVVELALSVVLAIGTTLLFRSFIQLSTVDLGYRTQGKLVMYADMPAHTRSEYLDVAASFDRLLAELDAIPGVQSAAAGMGVPMGRYGSNGSYFIEGRPMANPPNAGFILASADYFATMGVPLIGGREFTREDRYEAPSVAIINEALARRSFPNEDPINRRIKCGLDQPDKWMTIVGMVGNTRQDSPSHEPEGELYMPLAQHPYYANEIEVILRTGLPPTSLVPTVRQKMQELDPTAALSFTTLDEMVAASVATPRFRLFITSAFAGLAVLVAVVGLYGVMSYLTARRTAEIGVRMALGARPDDVLNMVLGQGFALALAGIAVGIAGALGLTHFLTGFLYGVKPNDPATFAAVAVVLMVVALVACWIPARRAMRVDPMVALRYE